MHKTTPPSNDYRLEPDGTFRIRNYASKKPFSNFLPGIAGLYGTPMWAFSVNRGQGIVSFGTKNKDAAILEFFPANKAYQAASSLGFRTFVKIRKSKTEHAFYEPFAEGSGAETSMGVRAHELEISETHQGLETRVLYFTVPGEPFAALARQVTFTNCTNRPIDIEVLDGLPRVIPFGMNEFLVKQMSRTIEAWMIVDNWKKRAPYFRLKVDAADRPEVVVIREGNFYFAMSDSNGRPSALLDVVIDPAAVFGPRFDFSKPEAFLDAARYAPPASQIAECRTPCAFSFSRLMIAPGKHKSVRSVIGHCEDTDVLNRAAARAVKSGYFEAKREENRRLIEGIKSPIFTVSNSPVFDAYCGQTYLDNVMRGGLPICFEKNGERLVYYVYSRKHGDLERDYNRFLVEPSYFSQGDGNYRDVNQNRRSDVWFEPRVGDSNVRTFMNLLQLDGFNPLIVKGVDLHLRRTPASRQALKSRFKGAALADVQEFLSKPFRLGPFYRFLEKRGFATPSSFGKLVGELLPFMETEDRAEHGEGFWVDHWTYNLDLVESYLAIFPEERVRMLFEAREYTFYDDAHRVHPRGKKFHRLPDGRIRQYRSVWHDHDKEKLIRGRKHLPHAVRTLGGHGEVYRTTLFAKLFSLFLLKLSSLDAQGAGIEMEADKPSWYDSLNGMPGLAGSSTCETFELKRLAIFLVQTLEELEADLPEHFTLPEELETLYAGLSKLLNRYLARPGARADLAYWDAASTLREAFRDRVASGISGREKKLAFPAVKIFLEHAREKIDVGLARAFDSKIGIFPTYFVNEVARFAPSGKGLVRPTAFRQKPMPFFLEGPVHALKVEKDPDRRRGLVKAVRQSALYDAKLGMYKVNAALAPAPVEAGRSRIFPPGWLENESVWLHMEYKFLLEMLKGGLHEEFFEDFKKALVPFQPAERYGRSPLENSSFIASSVFPDPSFHGTGFVARLSGSTAEFLQMWLWMNVGKKPFFLSHDGKVSLRFEPHLPADFFLKQEAARTFAPLDGEERKIRVPKDAYAFLFLGKTLVVIHNPKRLDTFGRRRATVRKIALTDAAGKKTEWRGDTIPAPWSLKVRDGFVPRIDLELG